MALLSDQDRLAAAGDYMADLSRGREAISGVTKAELRAAFNALDQFLSDNAATINSAIPQPARANLTPAQKARLLMAVITKRYLSGV